MKKLLLISALLLPALMLQARDFKWSRTVMDGSRTGVTAATADNVPEALGTVDGKKYVSPSGRTFRCGVTPEVARVLIDAQAPMAEVKAVIAHATEAMPVGYPECALSNWYVDYVMEAVAEKAGKPVSFAVLNFGGIRCDMPKGDILLDDIMSMFPFRNNLCYLELTGKDIRVILNQLAATSWQVVGGARCVVKDGKLVSAEIGGKPLDDKKVYGVATVNFLLDGGDDIRMARNAKNLEIFDGYLLDYILAHVRALTAEGKPIEYQTDGRIVILDSDKNSVRR